MSVREGIFLAWSLGVFLVAALFAYRTFRPTEYIRAQVEQMKRFPVTAAIFLSLVALTWPVSVPVLYYQSYRDEKREQQ